jgi:hypothetical protein
MNAFGEGRAITKAKCTKIRDLWDQEDMEWKSFLTLEMNSHIINQISRDIFISNKHWNVIAFPSGFKIGD